MKKKIKLGVFVLLILVMAQGILLQIQKDWKTDAETSQLGIVSQTNVGEIKKGTEITQTFTADKDFSGVALLMATYNKIAFSKVHLKLIDCQNEEVVFEKSYNSVAMTDNSFYNFLFDKNIEVQMPKEYKIVVTSNTGKLGNAVTIWSSQENMYQEGDLYINGEKQTGDLVFNMVYEGKNVFEWGMFLHRISLWVLFFAFLGLHCFIEIPKLYQWIFEKRVWVALAVFAFMVGNKYNFSSIEQFDLYVQPGEGSEYVEPVVGKSRAIRSDEWMINVPRFLSAEYSDYGKYNELVRAQKANNLSASGLYLNYSALAQPSNWGFYLFGSEYGLSFYWCFKMIFGFFFSYELCLILSKRKKLLSLVGASLIWFSSCNMWWSTINWILAGEAALVFLYYFLEEQKRRKRIFYGIGIAIFGSCFAVVDLYPAWLVPSGYIYLFILIWMFVGHWKTIRGYRWKDWLIVLGSIAFMVSIIVVYLLNELDYFTAIMNTLYPGKRVSYGGNTIQQLLGYIPTFLMPMVEYANPSEAGRFVTFFPVPYVMALILFIRSKKKDLLTGLLLSVTTVLSLYCIVELPAGIAKILLLTYSTPERMVLVVGYAQILLLIAVLGRYDKEELPKLSWAVVISVLTAGVTLWYTRKYYAGYSEFRNFLIVGAGVFGALAVMISKTKEWLRQLAMAGITVVVIGTGLMVHPLMCGIDAITSKPAAKAVTEIAEKDSRGKWIALDNIAAGNFLIACGAPAINSVNYVPNMDLWKKLDPDGDQEEVYNRYAHIIVSVSEEQTQMELVQADLIKLNLSYKDLEKLDVSYIYSGNPLENQQGVTFDKLYEESGVYIYKINY